jgi:UPF0716 protein FxsA
MPPLALILLLLLVALPLLELAILIKVGSMIGVAATFAIIFGTAICGIVIVRHQGFGVARRGLAAIRSGQPPVESMLDGIMLMFAGGCLIAPGLLTDAIGAVLLIAPLRRVMARFFLRGGYAATVVRVRSFKRPRRASSSTGEGPTIEGDYERVDERPVKPDDQPGHRQGLDGRGHGRK